MRLTADDLREIAGTVDKIKDGGINVEVVQVRGHRIVLKRSDSQTNGMEYYVIGMTEGGLSGPTGMVTRGEEGRREGKGTGAGFDRR